MLLSEIINSRLTPLLPLPTGVPPSGKPRFPVKAVLFDIYGTLLISASGGVGCNNNMTANESELVELFKRFGISHSPANLAQQLHTAISNTHYHMRQNGIDYPEVVIEAIWQSLLKWHNIEEIKLFALEYELRVNPVWPMPGLRPLLKELFLKKIPMGIISNAQFYTPLIFETLLHAPLAKLGFDSDLIFFSYQYQRAKPSKCLYEAAAQQLYIKKIEPNHVFFMGNDMLKDILPAHRIGFQTALFAGDARSLRLHRKDPKCYEKTAHVVVTDLTQLLKLIQIQQSP